MLSFEALQVLDAIDKQGSFSAAANALDKAPSSLSYQVQKLEQDLDVVIFDRSGHKAVFTDAGKLLLNRGRAILHSANELVTETKSLAHGWEMELVVAYEGLLEPRSLFPLLDKLNQQSSSRICLKEEILSGGWEALLEERVDILIAPKLQAVPHEIKVQALGSSQNLWVASSTHPIHQHQAPFEPANRMRYRAIIVADTARKAKTQSYNILSDQPRWIVSTAREKYHAIIDGYGIGTLPRWWVAEDIAKGRLKIIAGSDIVQLCWVMAWKRNRMGNAKSWVIRKLPSMLNIFDDVTKAANLDA